jgi:type II secretory ATPase GspE/PulE/Tfp pilus assembly ATPase PilB-like protein
MNDDMRQLITSSASEAQIREQAYAAGGGNLVESGVKLIMDGITTATEVLEATFTRGPDS